MKKLLCMILALCLLFSLAACGGDKGGSKDGDKPSATLTSKPPKETEAPQKAKPTPEEIATAIDKAETAEDFKAIIDSLEGVYGEDEPITLGDESITLKDIREMYEIFKSLGDEPTGSDTPEPGGDTPSPISPEAAAIAAGDWTGAYYKYVGDETGYADQPFSLTLNADGTGTHYRDDLEISVNWMLDGEDFTMTESFMGMTIDYTGTLADGVLRLFNGDPSDDFTCEYVYGQGDVSGIEVPHAEVDTSALGAFRGDWNGAMGFRSCTGKYEYLDNANVGAIARFAVQSDGSIEAFIGIDVEDTPFVDLTAYYSDFWENLMLSGSWIDVPFEGIPADVNNGTLNFVIPIEKEGGSLTMVFNLRRLGDAGWTDEDPGFSPETVEYCKDLSFGELAELLGYDFWDYPSPDEG